MTNFQKIPRFTLRQFWHGASDCLWSFQKLLQLIPIKAYDNLSVNQSYRRRHVPKLLQFGQRRILGGNVSIREPNLVL
jgi:hypothetical protein